MKMAVESISALQLIFYRRMSVGELQALNFQEINDINFDRPKVTMVNFWIEEDSCINFHRNV